MEENINKDNSHLVLLTLSHLKWRIISIHRWDEYFRLPSNEKIKKTPT